MKRCAIIFLSCLMLMLSVQASEAKPTEGVHDRLVREYKEKKAKKMAQERAEKTSIWDDDGEANPYFSGGQKKKAKKKKSTVKEPKRTTFKRRVYTGPSKDEIFEAATKKAISNFKSLVASDEYELKYEKISYNVGGDVLSVNEVQVFPAKGAKKNANVPYLMKAGEITLRNLNIGEKDGKQTSENGEMTIRKIEIPVWNEKNVKKGKVDISRLKMQGDILAYLKKKGEGKLDLVELRNLRSETIINETVLNNIVRSKIFMADSVDLTEVELQKQIFDSLKQQDVKGVKFTIARVNGRVMPTIEGVKAAMTSYSARVLNTDLVKGARLEAKKDNPKPDLDQLKKNIAENKAAVAEAEAEMKLK